MRELCRSNLALLAATLGVLAGSPAPAVIIDSGDGTGNTTPPPDDPGFALLNNDGTLAAPSFLLRFLSRQITWRYHFPRDLSAQEIANIPATLAQDGPRGLRTVGVHPLGDDFVSLNRFDSGELLPNPAPDQTLSLQGGALVTDVYLTS